MRKKLPIQMAIKIRKNQKINQKLKEERRMKYRSLLMIILQLDQQNLLLVYKKQFNHIQVHGEQETVTKQNKKFLMLI